MCIALVTTAHPAYPLILIDNRDEFLDRPTAPASYWPAPDSHVLGGRDLLRSEHGTWLGITRQGRIAVLTNFRETSPEFASTSARSRGAMVNAWLKLPPDSNETTAQFVERLVSEDGGLKGVGGFSLICGHISITSGQVQAPLAVLSNRTPDAQGATWIAGSPGETHGLSNSAYGDPWPKVAMGETLLKDAIQHSTDAGETKSQLVHRLLALLSTDTLPKRKGAESFETFLENLRQSIFIPAIAGDATKTASAQDVAAGKGEAPAEVVDPAKDKPKHDAVPVYGTQKQTVFLIDGLGHVTFVERTLFDNEGRPVDIGHGDRTFEFDLDRH